MAQASHLGRVSSLAQPCSSSVESTSRRASAVAAHSSLKNVKGLTLTSSLDGVSQKEALRRSTFGSSSVTGGGRKAVVCMAAGGVLSFSYTNLRIYIVVLDVSQEYFGKI